VVLGGAREIFCYGARYKSWYNRDRLPSFHLASCARLYDVQRIVIERITRLNTFVFKAVRLRALLDDPHAFGSTYALESQLTEADWNRRVENWNGERGAGFLAMEQDTACGIAGAFIDENDLTRAQLISMWTAPTHRERGVGRLLVDEVLAWAGGRNTRVLLLMVVSNNEPAIRFYQRLGFTRTVRMEPYPNDPAVIEYEMSRPIP
jgi:ribosomal protein S18 acetylase RimI-like enzyme